ncbi:hypothetical protein Tco_0961675 [Tanacetum coccineum]
MVVDEGVPDELTGTRTAGVGEIGLSIQGGSKYSSKLVGIKSPVLYLWGVKQAVATASANRNIRALENISIFLAASTRVRFRLSTTPFCYGVLGTDFW